MMRKLFAVALACAMFAPATAFAHEAQCSPGFWKNHTEVWYEVDLPRCPEDPNATYGWQCCAENIDSAGLLEDLLTIGACRDTDGDGTGDCPRAEAAEFLNSCFYSDYSLPEFNPCPNEFIYYPE